MNAAPRPARRAIGEAGAVAYHRGQRGANER